MTRVLRLLSMAAAVITLATCSLFDYGTYAGKRYALVYGVTNYINPSEYSWTSSNSPNLGYPAIDAQSMDTVLTNAGYTVVSARWVNSSSHVIYNGADKGALGYYTSASVYAPGAGDSYAPTKANIEADLQSLVGVVGANDTVVVYFSGHGTQDDTVSPTREYFDPIGSVQYYPTASTPGYYADVTKAVRDDELGSYFSALPTSRRILILDTCNSGGFAGTSLEVDATTETVSSSGLYISVKVSPLDVLTEAIASYASDSSPKTGLSAYNAQVISAAGKDESSYETSSLGHGVMTYFLIEAATKADLNTDGSISLNEAFAYVKAGIDQSWNANTSVIQAGMTFEPHISGGPVDFVLF